MVDRLPFVPVVNEARYKLQPVNYVDLGKAYYTILLNEETTENRDFILSGENPILLRAIFEHTGYCLNKKVKFISVPFWFAYVGSLVLYLISI